MKRSKFYMFNPTNKLQKEFDPNSKIIGVKMPSRFKRGVNKKKFEKVDQMTTTRKVFVQFTQYEPQKYPDKKRKCDFISGWICT